MKKAVSKKAILASVAILSLFTGCTKKSTPVVPYPSNGTQNQQTANNSQNYNPYQQTTSPNQAYYGNGAYVSDDASGFNTPANTTNQNNQTVDNTSSVPSGTSSDDLGLDSNIPELQPYTPPTGGSSSGTGSYILSGTFQVDQDSYISPAIPVIGKLAPEKNQWQAVGVAANGSEVFVTAIDTSGLFKKGTVIKMDSETGNNWKNIGSQWLGTRHPMDATIKGITVDSSGNIYANDAKDYIFVMQQPKLTLQKVSAGITNAIDIVNVNSGVIVATADGLKKYDSSALNSAADFAKGVKPTAGLGNDSAGNIYAIAGTTIKKITSSGSASDFITNVSGAVDVAVTSDNKVFVLTSDSIRMYDSKGKEISKFAQGEIISGRSMTASGRDIFVADAGSNYKDSAILKYSNMSL